MLSKIEMVLYNVIYLLPSVRLDSNMVCLNKNECGRNQLKLSCEQLSFLYISFACFGAMNGEFYVNHEWIHIEFYSFWYNSY